jgi:uncharacterized protein
MRIVLDTNVLVAAFITHGICNELLEHCALHHEIFVSEFILEEFRDTLIEKFGFAPHQAGEAVHLLQTRSTIVNPDSLGQPVSRDSDDDNILAAAVTGGCRCLVTGDKDLLCLERFQGIEILPPNAFWQFEDKRVAPVARRRGKPRA